MSVRLDVERRRHGTKFRLFPQPYFLEPYSEPETVWVSSPAGTVGPGPSDDRMYVIDPLGKALPYGSQRGPRGSSYIYLPPWDGQVGPPAMPNRFGHFDHLEPGTPEFEAAHLFGAVRWVLDIWEDYFGTRIPWHFREEYERLEMVVLSQWDNAQVGFGFLEVGSEVSERVGTFPFALSFDTLAHETGHAIIYAMVGLPTLETEEGEYFGFQESAADLVALLSSLHFERVVDHLLTSTSGNLYTFNELNRFAELSETKQIRIASNDLKMSDFAAGWADEHILAQPLTGAMFDIFVDVFQENLLERGLIDPEVEALSDQIEKHPDYADLIQSRFDAAYEGNHSGFKEALLDARDYLGNALAETWGRLSPHFLNYDDVGRVLLEVDRQLTGGRYQQVILTNFRWREIGDVAVGPRLAKPDEASHSFSDRTLQPDQGPAQGRLPYAARRRIARNGRRPAQ
ncbi:MAG: hypothetical protein OEM93_22005 [Rhodospirillales bacterium]|nr:hypothetical protein [Rhodospirillales bacterium]